MITTDYTDFNLELSRKKAHKINYKRIARIKILYYIFGVVLLFSGLGSYAYGCCDIICAPCIEQPNMPFCTSCIPTGCSYCGSGCCCPPKHCTNGVCCPSGQTGCGGTICCSSGETCCDNHCCPSGSTCCGAYGCCDTSTCERACVGGQCKDCGGELDQCCKNGTCVPKCENSGQCAYELPQPPIGGYANCFLDRHPLTNICVTEGAICAHDSMIALTDAVCATCAPGCSKTVVSPCITITPYGCYNDCYLWVCICQCMPLPPIYEGSHYHCAE
jgi:hypothetical protein